MYKIIYLSLFFFSLDQFSKWFVVFYLGLHETYVYDLNNQFINFYMAWNTGINFGLLESDSSLQIYFLFSISMVISIVLLIWVRSSNKAWTQTAAASVIGGAWGNAIDRIIHGAVADFINVTCCGITNPYSFNLADVFIFVGLIGLLVLKVDERPS